ncbi:MAG: hypothetical protein N838_03220 [Thiohalocapsa sp. PB-PSB1]|nr:MAG: hypothetical protein N838_03220 [Thiohalocapsa sp. PB-PSB1]
MEDQLCAVERKVGLGVLAAEGELADVGQMGLAWVMDTSGCLFFGGP